ncbi:MAG TPA: M3 family oligoendopeptidase [Chloroflexota bacterium]|nr:M3 family oligoendopeptidase [Chloroflexota bacterium]
MTATPTTQNPATTHLPHWDMTPIFPSLESAELGQALADVGNGLAELTRLCDQHGVRKRASDLIDPATVAGFEAVTRQMNALSEQVRTVSAYIASFVTTDSRNDRAQAIQSELQNQLVAFHQLDTRYDAWIGSLDVDMLIARSPLAQAHAFALRQAAEAAQHQMSESEEELAARLNLSSGAAWAKLHGNITSRLTVAVPMPDGTAPTLPMSAVRSLALERDGAVREAAYRAEISGWETAALPLAAAINSIKGEVNTLSTRRHWHDPLDAALFANAIDRDTLEAMQKACVEAFPDFRRYLRAKARLLGKQALPWWDIAAPVGDESASRPWQFEEAAAFLIEQFGSYSPRLAGLAQRAISERWIDAEPRDGKRDGAYCMSVRSDESRVMMNFKASFGSMQTMAHELGHAYHNLNLAKRTPMQRHTPMALAETASIFCETIVTNAALAAATPAEQLSILEDDLQGACQVVVDIHSRFLFEQGLFERRRQRELSVDELKALMVEAQRATYGDGLDQATLHPYMWAVKGHYYSSGRSYYNWPYTFGLLFGLGLYAIYQEDPQQFRAGYDELLSSTGLDNAASLARRFDIDIRSADFWRSSLDVVRRNVERFEQLAG